MQRTKPENRNHRKFRTDTSNKIRQKKKGFEWGNTKYGTNVRQIRIIMRRWNHNPIKIHFAIDARPGIMMKLISRLLELLLFIIVWLFSNTHFFSNEHVKPIEYVVCSVMTKICENGSNQLVLQVPILCEHHPHSLDWNDNRLCKVKCEEWESDLAKYFVGQK